MEKIGVFSGSSGKGKGEAPALNKHTAVESWPKEANCKYPGPAGGGGGENKFVWKWRCSTGECFLFSDEDWVK